MTIVLSVLRVSSVLELETQCLMAFVPPVTFACKAATAQFPVQHLVSVRAMFAFLVKFVQLGHCSQSYVPVAHSVRAQLEVLALQMACALLAIFAQMVPFWLLLLVK